VSCDRDKGVCDLINFYFVCCECELTAVRLARVDSERYWIDATCEGIFGLSQAWKENTRREDIREEM
jgi:hypothetical protein